MEEVPDRPRSAAAAAAAAGQASRTPPNAPDVGGRSAPQLRRDAAERHAAELAAENAGLLVRSRLLEVVAEVSTLLAKSPDFHAALAETLRRVGEAAGLSRVLLFETRARGRDGPLDYHVVAEWCAGGVRTHAECGTEVIAAADAAAFHSRLQSGESFWCRVDQVDPPLRHLFERMDIRATGCAPVLVDGGCAGAVAFDDCAGPRRWEAAQVDALTAAANAIGAAMQARRGAERLARERAAAAEHRAAELTRRNELLAAAAEASRVLIDAADLTHSIEAVLKTLAARFDVDRAVFGRIEHAVGDPTPWCVLLHEWARDGVPRQMDDPRLVRTHLAGPPELVEAFFRGEPIQGTLEDLPEPARSQQSACLVRSQFALPVLVDGRTWGVLGFDDCRRPRQWDAEEVAFLRVVATAMAAAVKRERAERERQEVVAREREAAAEQRAAELAKANDVLCDSLAGLSGPLHLNAFVGQLLMAIERHLAASCAVLFVHDPKSRTLRARWLTLRGESVDLATDPRAEVWAHDVPDDLTPAWAAIAASEQAVFEADIRDPLTWPFSVPWHEAMGHRCAVCVALRAGPTRCLGFLGVAFDRASAELTPALVTLAQALAQQATLALELTRLAEEAKQAALGREREAAAELRAAELAKVNETLRRGLDGVTDVGGRLDGYVASLLHEATGVFGADAAAVLLRDGETTAFRPLAAVTDGQLWSDAELAADPFLGRYAEQSANDPGGLFTALVAAAPSNETVFTEEFSILWPEAYEFHVRRHGHRISWQFPLRVRGHTLGFLAFAQRDDVRPTPTQVESVSALAQQLTLALELTRLADEAREAAVAREREAAAEQRAAELEVTTGLLARSIRRLAAEASPDAFVQQLHRELCNLLGGECTAQFRIDHGTKRLAGGVIVGAEGDHVDPHIFGVTLDEIPAWRNNLSEDRVLVFDLGRDASQIHHLTVDFMRRRGLTWLVNLPLFVTDRPAWVVAVTGRDYARLTDRNLELFRLLCRQLTLALELRQLAEDARETAVAREREAAAEQRAAELRTANDALRRAIDGLSGPASLHDFLTEMLRASLAVVGAHCGAVALVRGDEVEHTVLIENGRTVPQEEQERARTWRVPLHPDLLAVMQRTRSEGVVWAAPPDLAIHTAGMQDYHARVGNRAIRLVPMIVGETVIGWLGLGFGHPDPPVDHRADLLLVLTRQMTAAVEMTRLAEEAREAAVATERGAAAERRAAELRRINDALRGSVDALVRSTTVDDTLGLFVREAVRVTGADAGAVLERVDASPQFDVAAIYAGDDIIGRAAVADHPLAAEISAARRSDRQGYFASIAEGVARRRFVTSSPGEDLPLVTAFRHAAGRQLVWDVPYAIRGDVRGYLSLVFKDEGPRNGSAAAEALQALATQTGLALELMRLADAARDAAVAGAVAREREAAAERRAAELARVNDVLRQSVARLAGARSVDAMLDAFLLEGMAATGADAGAVVERVAGTEFRLRALARNGKPVVRDGLADDETFRRRTTEDALGIMRRTAAGETFAIPVTDEFVQWFPENGAWHRANGHRVIWHVPFRVADELAGYLGLAFRDPDAPGPVAGEALVALGHQASLALQALRLADADKEAAVARERQAAAEQRASELAKANAALRASASRLADSADLRQFLPHVLREAAWQVSATMAGLFLLDPHGRTASLQAAVIGEESVDLAADPRVACWREPTAVDVTPGWDELLTGAGYGWHDITDPGPQVWPTAVAFHRALGHRFALTIPLVVSAEPVGFLAFGMSAGPAPSRERLELARALADQAALAVRVTALADQARDVAVARVREAAAERRAAELEETNGLLARSIRRLAAEASPDAFVQQLHRELCDLLGGECTAQFRIDHATKRLAGGVRVDAKDGDFDSRLFDVAIEDVPAWGANLSEDRVLVLDLDRDASQIHHLTVDFMRRRALTWLVNLPLFVNDRPAWVVAVTGRDYARLTDRNLELFRLLSRQLTLALELRQLAEEARAAAVAKEREAAAEQRAADLASANAVVSGGLRRLATLSDVNVFLGHALKEIAGRAGASAAHVFRYDVTTDVIRQVLCVRHGEVFDPGHPDEPAEFRDGFRAVSGMPALRLFFDAGEIVFTEVGGGNAQYVWPFAVQWHRQCGHVRHAGVPLVGAAGRPVGLLGLAFTDCHEVAPARLELVRTLAHQIALALELSRLAAEAEQAAVAREREAAAEQRAAELAKANDVLRATVAALASGRGMDALLASAIAEAAHQADAAASVVFLFDQADDRLRLVAAQGKGRAEKIGEAAWLAPFRDPVPTAEAPAWQALLTSPGPLLLHAVDDESMTWPRTLAIHRAAGHRSLGYLRLQVGNRPLGFLGLAWTAERPAISPEAEGMLAVLAQQVALAIELDRLAGVAEHAAVVREREAAAVARTALLERTNTTLQHSLDLLAGEPDLDRFLGHVLCAVTDRLNVPHSTLWLFDPAARRNTMHMVCANGAVGPAPPGPDGAPMSLPVDDWAPWRELVVTRRPVVFDDAANHPHLARHRDWFRAEGVRTLLITPLVLGDEVLGTFGIHNTTRDKWTDDEVNLARAMAHQATLALRLTRLAAELRGAAVAREREETVAEERGRMAREIHDTLAQGFAAILVHARAATAASPGDSAAAVPLRVVEELAQHNLDEARRSVRVMRSVGEPHVSLTAELRRLAAAVGRRLGRPLEGTVATAVPEPPPAIAAELVRVAQEALNNAVRHAGTDRVGLSLEAAGPGVRVRVWDAGRGFDPAGEFPEHYGLVGMHERAAKAGADLTVISEPGAGTQIVLAWAPAGPGLSGDEPPT